MLKNEEFVQFLKSTLVKIENVINFLEQDPPKHILAYNKILGVQQKIASLDEGQKACIFSQLITTRSIVSYLSNGRYNYAYKQVLRLRQELVDICIRVEKNERDKDK